MQENHAPEAGLPVVGGGPDTVTFPRLIRHAYSATNAGPPITGPNSTRMTDPGHSQAHILTKGCIRAFAARRVYIKARDPRRPALVQAAF
jgi:hypothetical protein